VLASPDPRFEVVVSDNASPDHTQAIVEPFTRDNRLRYFRQPENIGAVRNFFFLAREAKGDYIFYLTDDDYLLTGAIEKVLDFILRFQPFGFKCSLLVHQIQSHAAYLYGPFARTFVAEPDDFDAQAKIYWNAHIATCTCIKRDVLDLDLYEQNLTNLYPSMMFMCMARERLGYLHEPIAVHIWENEVFWDDGIRPEESDKLIAHRGDLLNIFEHRVPNGFLVACEGQINRYSLNYAPIVRFLSPQEQHSRKVDYKIHAFNVRYSNFIKKTLGPLDNWIKTKLARFISQKFVQ
jgi:glycosyltransferase involved in cell wall biosynthesis